MDLDGQLPEWLKKELERYKSMYEHEKEQFEEFQRYSKELETELDTELTMSKKKIAEVEAYNRRILTELQEVKTRFEAERKELLANESQLRGKLAGSDNMSKEAQQKLRTLEQTNDDLERRERIQAQEIIDLNLRYEKCLERLAQYETGTIPDEVDELASPTLSHSNDVVMTDKTHELNATLDGTVGSNGFGASLLSSMKRATRVFSPHQERRSSAIVNSLFRKIEEVEKQVDPKKYVIHRSAN